MVYILARKASLNLNGLIIQGEGECATQPGEGGRIVPLSAFHSPTLQCAVPLPYPKAESRISHVTTKLFLSAGMWKVP